MSFDAVRTLVGRVWIALVVAVFCMPLAAADVSDTFESDSPGTSLPTGWSGTNAGGVAADAVTAPSVVGRPLAAASAQMYSITGSVTRTYSASESGARVTDMMVQLNPVDYDDDLPTSTDAKLMIALNANSNLVIWCKATSAAAAAWNVVGSTVYDAGTWARLTVKFDFTAGMAQVSLNGSLVVSSHGHRTASASDTTAGGWYILATNTDSKLASIAFTGVGAVDDLVNAAAGTYTPEGSGASVGTGDDAIPVSWFAAQGIAVPANTTDTVPGGSGYTYVQAKNTGVDPMSDEKFYLKEATFPDSGAKLQLQFTGKGVTYTVKKSNTTTDGTSFSDFAGNGVSADSGSVSSTWNADLAALFGSNDNVCYLKVTAGGKDTENTFGLLKVTSALTNTIISVPWDQLTKNGAAGAVTVAKLVMTENLTSGDLLLMYDGTKYEAWELGASGWSPIPTSSRTIDGQTVDLTTPAENQTLARGNGLWLIRQYPLEGDNARPFYLYGQFNATAATVPTVTGGSSSSAKATLLASPAVTAYDLNSKITGAPGSDEVRVYNQSNGLPTIYTYDGGSWGCQKRTTTTVHGITTDSWTRDTTATIPAGTGFFYINRGGSPTLAW